LIIINIDNFYFNYKNIGMRMGDALLVLILFYDCFMYAIASSNVAKKQYNAQTMVDTNFLKDEDISENILTLRQKGMQLLSLKDYKNAAKYYSASLQLMDGIGGLENGNLRRRCALTLAECEIQCGNYYNAINACSQIIDESPILAYSSSKNSNSSSSEVFDKLISQALGKAFYRRGISLVKLNQHQLALNDLKEAAIILPENNKVKEYIHQVKLVTKDVVGDDDDVENAHSDFIEEVIYSHPRAKFTSSQLKSMIRSSSSSSTSSSSRSTISLSGSSPFDDMLGFDISSLQSAASSSSPAAALSAFAGNILGNNGQGFSIEGIKSMAPLI